VIAFLRDQVLMLWSYLGSTFTPRDVVDILVVASAIYWVLLLIRGTRAVQMVSGLLVLMAVRLVADWVELETVSMILENFFGWAVVILVVIFQHDIRRALTRMGRPLFASVPQQEQSEILEEVVRAAQRLSKNGVGALVVFERENGLDDVVQGGVEVDAAVNRDVLAAIFEPGDEAPLREAAAGATLGVLATDLFRLAPPQTVAAALEWLGAAAGVERSGSRHRFVYAVAQHDFGDMQGALSTLRALHRDLPADEQALLALVNYSAETGDRPAAQRFAKKLLTLAPDNPRYRALVDTLNEG